MNQKTTEVRQNLGQGLWCLGSVSATAFFIGSLEMVWRAVHFGGISGPPDEAGWAAHQIFRIANTLFPLLAGLLIAVPTHICYRAVRNRQDQFALEMRLTTSEVLTFLARAEAPQ
jgi:biopolymer transport protein ExbB/TolQ